ncbi:unnamed protein product [Closterium sp. Yama58-4]|nr:unnamed protein product [Closterium sp. Yama58-4]
MVAGRTRKYYMVGGKGGVGKTSVSAALAVKFANEGHRTLVVSTDPAHSLSDSFAQDVSGGKPVAVEGTDLPLFAMEIDPEQAREEFRSATGKDGGKGVKDFMDSMGLGGWIDQLSELKLGELLDTPPPGLDEAVAIAKVVQFMQSPEYSNFTRIIFDTAPTGHTLRLLSLPDFLDASIGKILTLKNKISSATSAVKSLFGQEDGKPDTAVEKLEQLKERMVMVREIFRDQKATEFIIVTIPTIMAINESARLLKSLEVEGVPVKRLIVNQILPKSNTDCKFCNIKRKDQQRALDIVEADKELSHLRVIQSPLFDLEIRGVPALKFMGDLGAMARKRKSGADAATDVPRDLNEIPYIAWINKQIASGRKPAGPLPEGVPSPGATSYEAPRDVPTRGRRDADRVASSRVVDDTPLDDEEDDDSDYHDFAVATDDEADSGEEPDKGMSDSEDESEDEAEAPEETFPSAPATRASRAKSAAPATAASKGDEPPRRGPKTRTQVPVKRIVWSPLENTIFVAARWFMKDELEPLLGKQGSQYWARLVHHLEKENPGWVRGVHAVQKQWRNLVQFYKQLKKADKASGKGTVCKPPWYPYMELFLNNRAVANPHAVAAGGATNVNAPCGFNVPSTSVPTTTTPTFTGILDFPFPEGSHGCTSTPPQCTPPSKRPRVMETATMAAAKLVCETIKDCHQDAMSKLEGLVRAWMEQDERIARERLQQTAPAPPARYGAPPDAPAQTAANATDGGDDGWFRRGQSGDAAANPDEAAEVWVRGDGE